MQQYMKPHELIDPNRIENQKSESWRITLIFILVPLQAAGGGTCVCELV